MMVFRYKARHKHNNNTFHASYTTIDDQIVIIIILQCVRMCTRRGLNEWRQLTTSIIVRDNQKPTAQTKEFNASETRMNCCLGFALLFTAHVELKSLLVSSCLLITPDTVCGRKVIFTTRPVLQSSPGTSVTNVSVLMCGMLMSFSRLHVSVN